MDLNQFSTVDIVLDKANDNFIQKQTISAGDRNGRSLTLQVTDAGSIGEVPGLTANLLWTNHSSGVSDLSAFSVVDRATSVFKINYPQNMLTAGKVTAQIQLLYNGKVTHSKKFEIIVLDIAGKLKGVLQTAEYTTLVEALAKTNEFETDIAEVSAQLAHKAEQQYVEATNKRIDELVIESGDANVEVTDAHVSSTKNKTYTTLRKRFEETEKDTYKPLKNVVNNGNMDDGKSGWGQLGTTAEVTAVSNILKITATGNANLGAAYRDITLIPNDPGRKVFIKAEVKVTNPDCANLSIHLRGLTGGVFTFFQVTNPVQGQTYLLSQVVELPASLVGSLRLGFSHQYTTAELASGKVLEVQRVMVFDLIGQNLSDSYLKEKFRIGSYFEGVGNVFDAGTVLNIDKKYSDRLDSISEAVAAKSAVRLWDNESIEKTITIDTTGKNTLILNVINTRDTIFQLVNSELLTATNLFTGTNAEKIATIGYWQVDVSDLDSLSISNTISSNGATSTVEYWFDNLPRFPFQTNIGEGKYFNKADLIRTVTGISIQDYKNGIMYASVISENTLKTSEDDGLTFVDKYTFTNAITRVRALDSGNVLVHLDNGTLHVSTDKMQSFNQIADFSPQRIHEVFGFTVYENIVLITPYATISSGSPGKKVYMSTDSGLTFNVIFDLTAFSNINQSAAHTHSATYDPYEKIIWVCTGDGGTAQMIFYSKDMGNSWKLATKVGDLENQSTTIIPLRNSVLFVSDARLTGVLRYVRPVGGTKGSSLKFDYPLVVAEKWGKELSTEVPIASEVVIDYDKSVAYFSWVVYSSAFPGRIGNTLSHAEIYATDGNSFDLVYQDELIYEQNVHGIYGDATNGKIAAKVVQPYYNIKILDVSEVWENI